MTKNKTQLLCTFTQKELVDDIIKKIKEIYIVQNNKILIIENVDDTNENYCIYNIENKLGSGQLENTILIHRKREFNTLYTINSLNLLIVSLNDEKNKEFIVPWKNYKNMFLLIKAGKLNLINTQLKNIENY